MSNDSNSSPDSGLEAGLYVIATPIGNMDDITLRALDMLGAVDALACEDTRTTAKLLARHSIAKPAQVFSCHEHNEERALGRIRSLINDGRAVGLVSDAGMPAVSDPGYRVISQLIAEGLKVEVIPGANAATMALVASGLSTASYTFMGFLAKKTGKRKAQLEAEKESPHTLVIYESPHRIGALLADAFDVLGPRQATVALELSKKFERFHRGTLEALAAEFNDEKPRGEICVVIEGAPRKVREKKNKYPKGED